MASFEVLLRGWPAYLYLYRDMHRSVSYLEQLGQPASQQVFPVREPYR